MGLESHHCAAPVGHILKPMSWQKALVHAPFTHTGMFIGHFMPQAPQLFASLVVFTSQPSPRLLSQSANPTRHLSNTHWLFTHLLIAPGMLQAWQVQPPLMHTRPCGQTTPHAPQLFLSVPVATSQPSFPLLLQSLKPRSHLVTTHPEFAQPT